MATLSSSELNGIILSQIQQNIEKLLRQIQAFQQIMEPFNKEVIPGSGESTCERLLINFNSVTPKPEFPAVLEFYRQALSRCVGTQYTEAVKEIDQLLSELENR
jgi:hypothetical protein